MPKQSELDRKNIEAIVEAINDSLEPFEKVGDNDNAEMAKLINMKTRAAAANMYAGIMAQRQSQEYAKLVDVIERVEREMLPVKLTLEKQSETHSAFISGQQSIIAAIAATAGEHGEKIMEVLGEALSRDVKLEVNQDSQQNTEVDNG